MSALSLKEALSAGWPLMWRLFSVESHMLSHISSARRRRSPSLILEWPATLFSELPSRAAHVLRRHPARRRWSARTESLSALLRLLIRFLKRRKLIVREKGVRVFAPLRNQIVDLVTVLLAQLGHLHLVASEEKLHLISLFIGKL